MSYARCLELLNQAAGRELTDDEAEFLFREVRRRRDYILAKGIAQDSMGAALKAADELSNNIKMAAVIERRNAALNLTKRVDRAEWMRQTFGTKVSEAIETVLVGTNRAVTGARGGVAQVQHQIRSQYLAGLNRDLVEQDLHGLFAKGLLDRDVARAMWAIGKEDEALVHASLPKEAVAIAKIVNKWQEVARIDANAEGAWIGKLDGYIVRQSHDPYRISRAGKDAWQQAAVKHFDLDSMLVDSDADNTQKMLDALWVNLSTGNHLKVEDSGGFVGPGNLAKRVSQSRVIAFRDADAWFDYNQSFGQKNLREAVTSGLGHAAQSTGMMRVLGTNPKVMVQQLQKEMTLAAKEAGDTESLTKLGKTQHNLDTYMAVVDGSAMMPANQMGARWSAAVRGVQTLAKLGGMIASQLNDLAIYASAMKIQGRGYLSSMAEATAGLGKSLKTPERLNLLSSLDVTMESMIGELGRTSSFFEPGGMAKAQQLFMKLNLSQWWTERLKGAAAEGMSHFMALQKGKAFGALEQDYQRTLSIYGIGEKEWDTIRNAGVREVDGKEFVTPDLVKGAAQDKLRNYFTDRVGFAVIEPDAKTRAYMLRGTRPGTWEGEFFRFAAQFKSFTGAYMQKSIGQELYGRGYTGDSLWGALRNGNGEMLGLVRLIGVSTLLGYASLTLKDLMKNKSPRDVSDPAIAWKVFLASMVQGGGAGIYGDFLFGEASRAGSGTLESVAGPTVSTVGSVIDLYHRALRGDDVAATAFKTVLNNTPFINLFYTRMALDYLFLYDIQEQMNPGYMRRMESRMQKDAGQQFLVRPG